MKPKETAHPRDPLEVEMQFYEAHREEFLSKYPGKFVLIHGEELIDVYEAMSDAIDEGTKRFWPEPILVREAGAETLEFTAHALMLVG